MSEHHSGSPHSRTSGRLWWTIAIALVILRWSRNPLTLFSTGNVILWKWPRSSMSLSTGRSHAEFEPSTGTILGIALQHSCCVAASGIVVSIGNRARADPVGAKMLSCYVQL